MPTISICQTKLQAIGSSVSLHGWIGGITGNPTLVIPVPGHHYVAIHSPVGAPAVCMCVCVCVCVCVTQTPIGIGYTNTGSKHFKVVGFTVRVAVHLPSNEILAIK